MESEFVKQLKKELRITELLNRVREEHIKYFEPTKNEQRRNN